MAIEAAASVVPSGDGFYVMIRDLALSGVLARTDAEDRAAAINERVVPIGCAHKLLSALTMVDRACQLAAVKWTRLEDFGHLHGLLPLISNMAKELVGSNEVLDVVVAAYVLTGVDEGSPDTPYAATGLPLDEQRALAMKDLRTALEAMWKP